MACRRQPSKGRTRPEIYWLVCFTFIKILIYVITYRTHHVS